MRFGVVKNWDPLKRYGFINTDEDIDVFVHISDLAAGLKADDMEEGLYVKFNIKSDIKGDKAVNVRKA